MECNGEQGDYNECALKEGHHDNNESRSRSRSRLQVSFERLEANPRILCQDCSCSVDLVCPIVEGAFSQTSHSAAKPCVIHPYYPFGFSMYMCSFLQC